MEIKQLRLEVGEQLYLKKKSDFLKGKKLANIGKSEKIFKTTFDLLGYNYKINNLQAAVGIAQIKKSIRF